jgi:hypothetical protein
MSDEKTTAPAGGTAIPQDQTSTPAASPSEAGQENPQSKPVTQADLEAFAAKIVSRMQQSSKDRQKRIDAELTAIKSRLDVTGVQLNAEQEQALRGRIDDDLPAEEPAQASAAPQEPLTPEVQFVYDQIAAAFKAAGQEVKPSDPEYKLVADALNDEKGSLAATILAASTAATQKAQRLQTQSSQAAARVMSGGSAAAKGAPTGNASSLWGEAYRKQ